MGQNEGGVFSWKEEWCTPHSLRNGEYFHTLSLCEVCDYNETTLKGHP